jgi:hypothetical protein
MKKERIPREFDHVGIRIRFVGLNGLSALKDLWYLTGMREKSIVTPQNREARACELTASPA